MKSTFLNLEMPIATMEGQTSLEIGDVVIVHDETKPRGFWKVALVQELITGRDGQVRCATVKIGNGRLMRRPLQLLYPLEIKKTKELSQEENILSQENLNTEQDCEANKMTEHPRRVAAIKAKM